MVEDKTPADEPIEDGIPEGQYPGEQAGDYPEDYLPSDDLKDDTPGGVDIGQYPGEPAEADEEDPEVAEKLDAALDAAVVTLAEQPQRTRREKALAKMAKLSRSALVEQPAQAFKEVQITPVEPGSGSASLIVQESLPGRVRHRSGIVTLSLPVPPEVAKSWAVGIVIKPDDSVTAQWLKN